MPGRCEPLPGHPAARRCIGAVVLAADEVSTDVLDEVLRLGYSEAFADAAAAVGDPARTDDAEPAADEADEEVAPEEPPEQEQVEDDQAEAEVDEADDAFTPTPPASDLTWSEPVDAADEEVVPARRRIHSWRSGRSKAAQASTSVEAVFFDWGNTLMVDDGSQSGPMVTWLKVQAVDGAQDALRRLAPDYLLFVVTNADHSRERDVRAALARVGLDEFVHGIVTSREVGTRKPDAIFYRAALLRAGRAGLPLAPARAVMVGDSWPDDVAGARAAHLRTVWLNPSKKRRPTDAAAPDAEIRKLAELPEALARL